MKKLINIICMCTVLSCVCEHVQAQEKATVDLPIRVRLVIDCVRQENNNPGSTEKLCKERGECCASE